MAAWLAAFVALLAAVIRAAARARRDRGEPVPRGLVAAAALLVAALGASAAWAWGAVHARGGIERIRAAGEAGPDDDAPARARLFLRATQLAVPAAGASVGYAPGAALRLPRGYGLDEAQRGWDLLDVTVRGPQGLAVATRAPVPGTGEPTSTRVVLAARPRPSGALPPLPDEVARLAASALDDRRCAAAPAATTALDGPGVLVAVLCRGPAPVAALAFDRDLGAEAALTSVRVTPLVWRGTSFRPHHVQIGSGALLQIGALADAVPGVTLWEVPAPVGRAELFFPPDDILAPCRTWIARRGPVAPATGTAAPAEATPGDRDSICILPFQAPFALEVRRLLPDVAGVDARSAWAAGLLVTPALLALLVLAARPRGELTRERFARALALGWVGSFVAALGVWRLLWAHRIDMLRDYEAIGSRVVANQTLLVLVAAALAATAVLVIADRPQRRRALPIAAGAWLVTAAAGGLALQGDLAAVLALRQLAAQVAVSLAVGTALGWGPWLAAIAVEAGARLWTRAQPALGLADDDRATAAAVGALLAIAAAATAGDIAMPRHVAAKLALAYLTVGAAYAALRAAIAVGPVRPHRIAAAVLGLTAAAGALYRYDAGITAAVLGPGLVLALLFASHDARYGDALLRHMASFERHHAPLVIAHTAILAGAALGALAWALAGDAAALGPAMTRGALHGLAVFAALMLAAAALGYLRRGPRAALPWALAAVALAALWAGRGAAVERVIEAPGAAAARVAIVLEPGYAALRDPQRFLSGITAWRETIAPSGAADGGQGYFGAQVLDPGVLLSIENDYFPVLLLRETGAAGIVMVALLLLALVTGLWLVAGERFLHGSRAQRTRALAAAALGVLCLYQPLASLGVLPLTGITWPGLGLDSPTDLWILVIAVLWIAVGGDPAAGGDATAWRHDAELRTTRVFRRVRTASAAAAALVAIAGLALVARASSFALDRPGPVDDEGRATPAFAGLERAVAYALGLSCPWQTAAGGGDALVPRDLLGEPLDSEAQRYHGALRTTWQAERGRAVAEIDAFLAAPAGEACRGSRGRWRFERRSDDGATCLATFSWGWPEVELAVTAPAAGAEASARCAVELPGDVLAQLRFPSRRPYRGARVRLVSSAMGAAAADRGELVAGHVTVRLRPGAGELDVSQAQAGIFAAEKVRLSDDLTVEIATDGAALRAHGRAWMFVKRPPRAPVHLLEADAAGWRLVTPPGATAKADAPAADSIDLPLERLALLVVGGPEARNLWLFRPPRAWGEASVADPLLADDISTVGGERRRHYIYGGNLPELGWVNPYHRRMSLGLDGWVHVALAEIDRAGAPDGATWTEGALRHQTCGTLATTPASPQPVAQVSALPAIPAPDPRVCTASPFDGVLECRVALQPELSIQLRHLTELIALDPTGWATRGTPATRAAFTLLRGDTGEIVAQGDFVPGRASSAYAPATPEIEQHLVRLREDRDPATGAKLPRAGRGESSAEKADWNQPVAVGSTLKPVIARAAELAAPDVTAQLVLRGGPRADAACRRTAAGKPVHAVLGHCPPTPLLAGDETLDVHGFLARSSNWFMAALGLVATALPDGAVTQDGVEVPLAEALARDVGAWSPDHPLVTRKGDVEIVGSHSVSLPALRQSALWQGVEALVGRPLCTDGDKAACRRAGDRRDVCAARALPVAAPSADLRHLVALGPDRFDLYGDGSRQGAVPIRDYFQFLRGAGLHPLGSLAQLTDTFGRVVYDPGQVPATGGAPRFALAASWFPVARTGTVPAWSCASGGAAPTVLGADGGLCGVVRAGGTAAAAMKPVLADPRITVHAAKTGTIDALADVSENRTACERWNETHTVAGRPARADQQPYWLRCEEAAEDDSLFLLAFSVAGEKGPVPFTLGLRFERAGKGVAAAAARQYVAAIAAYVSGPSTPSPASLPAPSPPAPSLPAP